MRVEAELERTGMGKEVILEYLEKIVSVIFAIFNIYCQFVGIIITCSIYANARYIS